MDTIKFQNIDFKIREIKLPEIGEVLISTSTLNNILLNEKGGYTSEEASNIDSDIYYYVEENEIKFKEEELIKLVTIQTA